MLSVFFLFLCAPFVLSFHKIVEMKSLSHYVVRFYIVAVFVSGIAAFMLETAPLHAQQAQAIFALRDTSAQRGSFVRIPLAVSLRNVPARIDSMRLVVRYTPSVVLVDCVRGGGTNIIACPTPRFTTQFQSLSEGVLTLTCNQIRPVAANNQDTTVLCMIDFRVLASADSLATIRIESLTLNATDAALVGMRRSSTIRVFGEPSITTRFTDAIEQNYPNPIASSASGTTFPYTLAATDEVQFSVYSLRGEEVFRFPAMRQTQGRYFLRYVPEPSLPNGLYSLRMLTRNGAFRQSFMMLR